MGNFVGALGINLPSFVAQLINFLILFGLLTLVAYKPVMKMFDERAKKVKESLEQAEIVRQQAAKAEDSVKKKLEEAAKEGQEVINRAMRTAEESRQAALQQAKQEAESLITRARGEIQLEKEEAIDSVRKEFADLTVLVASKVIERSLDKKAHQEIIEKVLKESQTLKKG